VQPGLLKQIPARRWLTVLLAGIACLAGWQVWLTVRLLEQDRNLEAQQSRERLGRIADLVVARMVAASADWDTALHELKSLPPSSLQKERFPNGATFLLISQDGIKFSPQKVLLFSPLLPIPPAESDSAFEAADVLELREKQYDRAIAALRPLVLQSPTRPEALLRIARIESKSNRPDAALDTYRKLEEEATVNTSGIPYPLLAASARCRILIDLGEKQEASVEARAIQSGLLSGRWPLSREAFEYQWSGLDKLGISVGEPPPAAIDFADLVARLYGGWQRNKSEGDIRGRTVLNSSPVVWDASSGRLAAALFPPDWLGSSLKLPPNSADIRWKKLENSESGSSGLTVTRSLTDAKIAGKLEFWSEGLNPGADSSRRSLLLGGAALMLLVILGSGYVVHRAISRELRVAQLQSDFVAAVSHEFRSPLTTLRTITELLAQNRITAESHRQQSYIYLDRETMRLHRLVEDLLDFGRMESGRKQYRMEAHDAFQLVRTTVADFNEQAAASGFRVETELDSSDGCDAARIHVDEEAFRRAFRNLLDNAMKYSPDCRTAWVKGDLEDHRVLISVRDRGMGIDGDEKQAIFQKFVRGQAAKKAGIKGTGIGLAMVRQICEAMGGEIRLQSEAGVGSTFTLVLPLAED